MTRFDLASKTHPSYTFADDVTLPEGFTDSSYHHDEGPSFRHGSGMCAVYFNYPSTNPHISPYMVSTTLDQRGIDSGEARHYWYKCMTWAEVLGHIDTWRKRTGHEVARHTPGPREYSGVTIRAKDINIAKGAFNYCPDVSGDPAWHGQGPEESEAYANAHLIASAPELLEALEGLLEQAEAMYIAHGGNQAIWGDALDEIDRASDAIVKARGGA